MKNRKINKVKVSIVLIILLILLMNLTGFGRFIYNSIKDRYLSSQSFYFTSNLLDVNNAQLTYNNWTGTDVYKLDIALYSYENELLRLDEDLDYTITCSTTSTKIDCRIGSQADGGTTATGTIEAKINNIANNEKVISIYLVPKDGVEFDVGEKVVVTVRAFTTEPYAKTISADFTFDITTIGADYQIEDIAYRNYVLVKLKNTEPVDSSVTLKFDPDVVRLDMNDEAYLNNLGYETENIGGHDYITEITFLMAEESSKNIKFYKVDKSQDYTTQLGIFEVVRNY